MPRMSIQKNGSHIKQTTKGFMESYLHVAVVPKLKKAQRVRRDKAWTSPDLWRKLWANWDSINSRIDRGGDGPCVLPPFEERERAISSREWILQIGLIRNNVILSWHGARVRVFWRNMVCPISQQLLAANHGMHHNLKCQFLCGGFSRFWEHTNSLWRHFPWCRGIPIDNFLAVHPIPDIIYW